MVTHEPVFVKVEGAESEGVEPHPSLDEPIEYQSWALPERFTLRYRSPSPHAPDTMALHITNSMTEWHNIP